MKLLVMKLSAIQKNQSTTIFPIGCHLSIKIHRWFALTSLGLLCGYVITGIVYDLGWPLTIVNFSRRYLKDSLVISLSSFLDVIIEPICLTIWYGSGLYSVAKMPCLGSFTRSLFPSWNLCSWALRLSAYCLISFFFSIFAGYFLIHTWLFES
jgi:hypothetical protein